MRAVRRISWADSNFMPRRYKVLIVPPAMLEEFQYSFPAVPEKFQ